MKDDYVLFQKFTDIESAHEFAAELRNNGIDYHLVDHNKDTNVKITGGYHTIDIAFQLNIMVQDFPKAELFLEAYYNQQIKNIDTSYYLFESSTEELKDIVMHPFEWGRLDFQLAKSILKERGQEISEAEINSIKTQQIAALSTTENVSNFKIVTGYLLAIIIPVIPILLGILIKYNRKVLPNGEKFYIHTEKDRNHGHRIIVINLVYSIALYIYMIFIKD